MKKILVSIVLLWSCLIPLKAFSIPMLSDDGSLLTGVLVNGQLYDVTFGDAVLGDIYSIATIDTVGQANWYYLTNAVQQGIVDALNALPTPVMPGDIKGCDGAPSIIPPALIGPSPLCMMLIPDQYSGLGVADTLAATVGPINLGPTVAYRSPYSAGTWVSTQFSTTSYGEFTVARFRLATAAVPAPGSLPLAMLALFAMAYRRRAGKISRN